MTNAQRMNQWRIWVVLFVPFYLPSSCSFFYLFLVFEFNGNRYRMIKWKVLFWSFWVGSVLCCYFNQKQCRFEQNALFFYFDCTKPNNEPLVGRISLIWLVLSHVLWLFFFSLENFQEFHTNIDVALLKDRFVLMHSE